MMLILVLVCLFKASSSHVITFGNKPAHFGEDAYFGCTLNAQTGVQQVTWQRLFNNESPVNLATYSTRFGPDVALHFTGKVILTEASLNSTAITLKNVTWEDESCYICSFNVYPDGSKRNQICLTVQGISHVNTSHTQIYSGEEESKHEFSCSATGKPAPKISWDFSGGTYVTRPETSTVRNADGTFISSSSITLTGPAGWSGHVDCLLSSGTQSKRQQIFFSGENDKEGEEQHRSQVAVGIIAMIVTTCTVAAAIIIHKRLKRKAAVREIP